MKSYNEMAQNALRRIDEENKKLIKRKKVLKRTLIPTLSLCLAAVIGISVMGGFGIKVAPEIEIEESFEYQNEGTIVTEKESAAGGSARPNDQNGGLQPNDQTTAGACIHLVNIYYEGKTYVETENKDMSDYQKDNYLGDVDDFYGYYKPKYANSKVYTVKNSSEFLLLELDDGKAVLLKEIK